ncbi:hypothetical protein P691DRAFT_428104 [Macrolepiota fuliginosa MF-IS2]|uniref:Uncharacterized protein n=1 Tax=Macrolepiota fuliginosa MF-IS2 TaxID=1400762 RepID=A0A9P5XG78_9AGAR|nr:hypothetical protein P691DRAFT_428104 [Macrolepiota fuliginosa MF-IS2]
MSIVVAFARSARIPFNDPSAIPPQVGRSFAEYVSGWMFEVFLYGINIMLFSTTVLILMRRSNGMMVPRWPLLVPAVAMFTISTANVCLSVYMLFGVLIYGTPLPVWTIISKHMFYLINNVIADSLLLYRCYIVWSRSVYIAVIPGIFLLASSILGLIIMSGPTLRAGRRKFLYMWLTLALNISVTALTAGRIWWMANKARRILGPALARRYYSALATIIESGAIYSLYVMIDLILLTIGHQSFIFDAGLAHIVAIAPTLIIVQVGLGCQIQDVETTIRLSRGPSVVLSTVQSDIVEGDIS